MAKRKEQFQSLENKQEEVVEVTPVKVNINKGLTTEQVEERKLNGLTNQITNKNLKTNGEIISKNVFTVFNLLNLGIAIALIVAGSYKNLLFLPIVIINTLIGIIQEIRARNTMAQLSLVDASTVTVIRNGIKEVILSDDLVIDDIVYYDSGKQIVADGIVKRGIAEINESMLTGESDLITKKANNLVYAGSFVVSGECYCKVERVGENNYIQQLSKQAKKYSKPKSEIMNALSLLIKIITVVVILLGIALFLNNYLIGYDIQNALGEFEHIDHNWRSAITYTAGSMIGMIPSGLFLMTSMSLALGVIKLANRNTLVHDLYCIEMLARIDTLCLDKTGTITDGSMKVRDAIEYNQSALSVKQIIAFILGNTKEKNPTAVALEKKFGKIKKATTKAIIPFSSARKYMAAYDETTHKSYILGAPEFILKDNFKTSILSFEVEKYAKQGLRVLLVADSDEKITDNDYEFESVNPLALITIEDVIRKDALETIQYFKDSGVDVKVISGDNEITVSKIAARAGVENANKRISLDGKSDEEVAHLALSYTVFGRVSPKQKQIIIKALKDAGRTVAMTGDGVNDILAMKESHCSIAMANGSEATRNVAHLVLLDSNFSSMPFVVKEGRRVINNIKRVATMFLTKTLFSFLLTLVVLISSMAYPIQTIQLTLFDWFVVSIPSFYLALEPNNNLIKGKFLKDVIVEALPGAVLIVLSYITMLVISSLPTFEAVVTHESLSTMTVLSTIGIGFLVLYKTCRPFNNGRVTLYITMLVLFAICLFNFGGIFEIKSFKDLGITNTLLLSTIFLLNTHIYKGVNNIIVGLRDRSILDKISAKFDA